jgi:uncharacterized protein
VTLAVDVRDLIDSPGASRVVRIEERVEGLHAGLGRVPPEDPVEGEFLLESLADGVLVSGPMRGERVLECARCLRPVHEAFRLDVHELFSVEDDPEADYALRDGIVDLEPMIRDAVLLSMPFSPLCRPECLGLCPRCGGDLNLGECACPPEVDERWAVLSGLILPGDPDDDRRDVRPGGETGLPGRRDPETEH